MLKLPKCNGFHFVLTSIIVDNINLLPHIGVNFPFLELNMSPKKDKQYKPKKGIIVFNYQKPVHQNKLFQRILMPSPRQRCRLDLSCQKTSHKFKCRWLSKVFVTNM